MKKPKFRLIKGGGENWREIPVHPMNLEEWVRSKPQGTKLTINHSKDLTMIEDLKRNEVYVIEHCPHCGDDDGSAL